jgi:hypothetical protein
MLRNMAISFKKPCELHLEKVRTLVNQISAFCNDKAKQSAKALRIRNCGHTCKHLRRRLKCPATPIIQPASAL